MLFEEVYQKFRKELGKSRTTALSTFLYDAVTLRIMSLVMLDDVFPRQNLQKI